MCLREGGRSSIIWPVAPATICLFAVLQWSWLMNIGLHQSKIENPKKRTNISKTIVWNFVFRSKYLLLEPCFSINLTSTSSSTTSISCNFQNLKYTINRVYKSWIETRSVTLAWWQYHCAIQWCNDKLITNVLHRSKKLKWSIVQFLKSSFLTERKCFKVVILFQSLEKENRKDRESSTGCKSV